jgi:putative restriction endonuclease
MAIEARQLASAINDGKSNLRKNWALSMRTNWSRQETLAALHVYMLLSFGQLHARNPLIGQLAHWIGRTPNSVALKLVNFASLDPQVTASGRKGMGNTSALDQSVWSDLNHHWTTLTLEAAEEYERLATNHGMSAIMDIAEDLAEEGFVIPEGRTRSATVQVRVNQARFRKAVLAGYNSTCCISGLRHQKLVVASHIVPWSIDQENRLNPRNGLCLSALHDRAFDQGLITISDEGKVLLSKSLREMKGNSVFTDQLLSCENVSIQKPQRFAPVPAFLQWHRENLYRP